MSKSMLDNLVIISHWILVIHLYDYYHACYFEMTEQMQFKLIMPKLMLFVLYLLIYLRLLWKEGNLR